jgi:hypothetical protein
MEPVGTEQGREQEGARQQGPARVSEAGWHHEACAQYPQCTSAPLLHLASCMMRVAGLYNTWCCLAHVGPCGAFQHASRHLCGIYSTQSTPWRSIVPRDPVGSATLASLETFGTGGKSTGVQFVSVPCSIIFSCDMPCASDAARIAPESVPHPSRRIVCCQAARPSRATCRAARLSELA